MVCAAMVFLCGWAGHCKGRLQAAEITVRLTVDGRPVEGMPISWSRKQMFLLCRNGELLDFRPAEATDFHKVSDRFYSYTQAEMRGVLYREFGKRYEVSGTGHYLVVHPAGQRDRWAKRFEELYRSFTHYFSSRGIRPSEPTFPLVAVVFNKRQDFVRFASQDGVEVSPGLRGYYSPTTNRILLYNVASGKGSGNWHTNAETIIHEATHQTAFNTGIHTRFGTTPRWVVEGLGTMFEAPGVWNPRQFTERSDRINQDRLKSFQRLPENSRRANLVKMIKNDDVFKTDPETAYAEAWALTFFLAELEPRKYWRYLQKTAASKPFLPYSSARREEDFSAVFGRNLGQLDARMKRFLMSL